ncbi:MAG TPA: citrate synthase/methylcitrate synthase [bacterium]|nr:citrate synthase/methylcitrate synthase [bacterium]HQL61832.1 citrate synthase/methylcitrate synthase [bacterium]
MNDVEAINGIVRQAAEKAAQETNDEPEPTLVGELNWPITCELRPGLEGAIACGTKIGYVNGSKGWLIYRGIHIFELAEKSSFEETSYLLLYGKLPTRKDLDNFRIKLAGYMPIDETVLAVLKRSPTARVRDTHPMTALGLCVLVLGMLDEKAEDTTVENEREIVIKLIAQIATITGMIARLRSGRDPVEPEPSLSHAANLLYMMTGERPSAVAERIMDISLILHADHGMNASTFSAMVINSSLANAYATISGAIGSLKGSLHGGANERVLYDMEEIGSVDNVEAWFQKARESKRKIMGFGHRVYKAYDPRARILGPLAGKMAENNREIKRVYDIAKKLDEIVCAELGVEKKVFPNVDFYSGIVYRALGIHAAMFTPIFAASRISGWGARFLEYLENNRIFRPRAVYTGPVREEYTPIDRR